MSDFKINNNYTPYFGDHFMWLHPEHKGFFETRSRKNSLTKKEYWQWVNHEGFEIFKSFESKALQLIRSGKKRYSVDAIIHVIRFEWDTRNQSIQNQKNENSYAKQSSYYGH